MISSFLASQLAILGYLPDCLDHSDVVLLLAVREDRADAVLFDGAQLNKKGNKHSNITIIANLFIT
jgi:hypothetical protein